ncbi:MAG TPA: hypothetical protein VL563_08885 [Gemmatimonadales bacterium]|jgi:hypothetical protein|nr:hypothetical protein [Gemmatimonadales bacterium]
MRPHTALFASLLLAQSAGLAAQDPTPLCYQARPKPACSAFAFTSFGAYALFGNTRYTGTALREVADWGAMVNVGEKDAVGGSVFASLDRDGFALGPAARYRRWLSASASVEVAVGTPLVTSTGDDLRPGSVFGLVKWSPNDWFSIGARPELARGTTITGCGPAGCATATRMRGRLSVGMEIGRVPGVVLTALGGAAGYLLAALAAMD